MIILFHPWALMQNALFIQNGYAEIASLCIQVLVFFDNFRCLGNVGRWGKQLEIIHYEFNILDISSPAIMKFWLY